MERKNYLVEELNENEKSYLSRIVSNTRNKYVRDNYDYLNTIHTDIDISAIEDDVTVEETVILMTDSKIKSTVDFVNSISDEKLHKLVKALPSKQKEVLFYCFNELKKQKEISNIMKIDRITVYRICKKAIDKIKENYGEEQKNG